MKEAEALAVVQPAVAAMLGLVERIGEEKENPESLLACASGLIGDLASTFGKDIAGSLETPNVMNLLQRARRARSTKSQNLAKWATKQIRAARSA